MTTRNISVLLRLVITALMILAVSFALHPAPSAGAEDDTPTAGTGTSDTPSAAEEDIDVTDLVAEEETSLPETENSLADPEGLLVDPSTNIDGEPLLESQILTDPMVTPFSLGDGNFDEGIYWKDEYVAPNPTLEVPQTCIAEPLEIGLIFDLSNSIADFGLAESINAALAAVDQLAGTPTKISLFTFASDAPAAGQVAGEPQYDLRDPDQVEAVKDLINALVATDRARGGTNWEGALRQVNDTGIDFDTVFFVTDGKPTVDDIATGAPGGGNVTHNAEIRRAIVQANELKENGTRIEVLAVGDVGASYIVRDNVVWAPISWIDISSPPYYYQADRIQAGTYVTVGESGLLGTLESATAEWMQSYIDDGKYLIIGEAFDGEGNKVYDIMNSADEASATNDYDEPWNGTQATADEIFEVISDSVTPMADYGGLVDALLGAVPVPVSCEAGLVVEKQIVDAEGNIIDDGGVSGWQFDASNVVADDLVFPMSLVDEFGGAVSSLSQTTGADGIVRFDFEADEPHTTGRVTVEEVQQDRFELRPQDGKNAVCETTDGVPVEVDNIGETGFRVDVSTDFPAVFCTVHNTESGSFKVEKLPQADQNPDIDGDQPKTPIAFDGSFDVRYDIKVTNNSEAVSELDVPVVDRSSFPTGFDVTDVRFYLDGKEITDVVATDQGYEIPPAALGQFAGQETKTIKVVVSGIADQASVESVVDGSYEVCEAARPESDDYLAGLFNSVYLEGEDDPDGESNNHACVDPQQPGITVDKVIDDVDGNGTIDTADTGNLAEDGTRYASYTVTVDNPQDGITRTYSLSDLPLFADAVDVEYAIVESIHTALASAMFEGTGPYAVTEVLNEGEEVSIEAGQKHTYTVRVHFSGPSSAADRDQSWECSADGETTGGGLLNTVELESGAVTDEDDACGPIPDPEKVSLILEKVGADDKTTPLAGAGFALFGVNPDGSIGEHVIDLTEGQDGFHTTNLEAGVEYFLVETRSPQDYQLLPVAVKIVVNVTPEGSFLEILNPADAISATVGQGEQENTVYLQVADIRIGDLPKTGGMGVGVISILGMLILGSGAIVGHRRAA